MDRFKNLFKKKQTTPTDGEERVLQRRRQKRPAPAPPIPNTPQLQTAQPTYSTYAPPTSKNLFSGYKYSENVLNPWGDNGSSSTYEPTQQIARSDISQTFTDPVDHNSQNYYDRQLTYK